MNETKDKEKKAGSPIFILIIFIAIIAFVIFIPDIYEKFNSTIAETLGIGSKNKPLQHQDDTLENENMSDYYQLGSNKSLTFKELNFTDIKLEDNLLEFTLSTNGTVNLDNLNYYLEFYEEKMKFLGRRILRGELAGSKNYKIDVSNLDISTTTYMSVSHISDDVIPSLKLPTDESGLSGFTCSLYNDEYTYDFYQDKLLKVTRKYTYENDDLDLYSKELFKYRKLAKEYNELTGVTASIADGNEEFIYTIELDYENIDSIRIDDDYKFSKNVKSNIVKYKMEAEGFICQ